MTAAKFFTVPLFTLLVLSAVPFATAVPVTDLEGADWDTTGFTLPTGDLVAEDNRPVTFVHTPPAGYHTGGGAESAIMETTYRSRVLRDPATQFLTFVYTLDRVGELGTDNGEVLARSFANFSTDVTGLFSQQVYANRSPDGTIKFSPSVPGQSGSSMAGVPTLVIATDATNFDRNGSIDFTMTSEFGLLDSEGGYHGDMQLTSFVQLTGTFQPAAASPSAIPLPPAVLTGGMTLAAAAVTAYRAGKARH